MKVRTQVRVLSRRTLNGTIDGHDPLVVTFRIKGEHGWFRLTVVTVNWGRGYDPGEFKRNVVNLLNKVGEREYVVILMQEIDEADAAPEHKDIRQAVNAIMEPGTTLVEWWTREPIAVSPGIEVHRQRKRMTMDQGSAIGAPKGTGPKRFYVSCIMLIEGVLIGVGNQHPHRVDPDWSFKDRMIVRLARLKGRGIVKQEIRMLVGLCDMVTDGGDLNDLNYPLSHPRQVNVYHRANDYIRSLIA